MTGTGIWVAGAVGLTCGAGQFIIAGTVTLFTLIILVEVGWVEHRLIADHDR